MLYDYELLRVIWWVLLGFLLIGFAITGGMDLGVGTLLPFVARNNIEKRVLLNSIGPTWEGNQVWFILGGGAIFAAWPYIYSVAFSVFYIAFLLILLALILRPVGFDFRNKINSDKWRATWDKAIFIAGVVPSLIFGVAVGNIMQGISFSFDEMLVISNQVTFWSLFTPFTLLCGILSVAILTTQGAAFLSLKTKDVIANRSRIVMLTVPFFSIALFAIGGYMVNQMNGYLILDYQGNEGPSNPLSKLVLAQIGAWLLNYDKYSWMVIAPICGFVGAGLVIICALTRRYASAFLASSLSLIGIISTVGFSMFPFILPSNLNYNASLTVWDASSSRSTLLIMLGAVLIFMPIILSYTSWVYKVMFGKVTIKDITEQDKSLY
jgi:cytochrome d ubiquinol oxidase subunit II